MSASHVDQTEDNNDDVDASASDEDQDDDENADDASEEDVKRRSEEEEEEEEDRERADHEGDDEESAPEKPDDQDADQDDAVAAEDAPGDHQIVSEENTLASMSDDDDSDDEDNEDETEASAVNDDEDENEEDAAEKDARASREELFERYKDAKRRRSQLLRNYKIQEVIKRRQILLIQVVKEERGNKGAALTTYLSLAGRYCVLMPNTARGGGISRKIANGSDRRRLRRVVDSLDVPQGMGLIIRTAGSKRTKTEIKRDYDYLLRMWENIRSLTLKSIAPCLIYEEASLIKRAIRDLYDKDISKVFVEGEEGYREAKDFMKLLMPSHAKNVQPHKDRTPIFLNYGVESQLDGMYQPTVRLKSGGYLVIHQTEALVAIDVNSGRATRERNIEQTALKTNIEAAEEASRQFRLRDLAGLIVIDFIDMEEPRNNRKVEKALKEAMKSDRARVQIGRISSFGLMELSRQRRRSGIVDGTTQTCPTCAGAGVIRSHDMAALRILRAVEGEAISGKVGLIAVRTSTDVALHVLNHNRDWLNRIERNNGVSIEITADPNKAGDDYDLEKSGAPREPTGVQPVVRADQTEPVDISEEENHVLSTDDEDTSERSAKSDDKPKRKRRRRRGRKDAEDSAEQQDASESVDESEHHRADEKDESDDDESKPKKRRRRGRRGGRRNRRDDKQADANEPSSDDRDEEKRAADPDNDSGSEQPSGPDAEDAGDLDAVRSDDKTDAAEPAEPISDEAPANGADADLKPEPASAEITQKPDPEPSQEPKKPSRKGWWQRSAS